MFLRCTGLLQSHLCLTRFMVKKLYIVHCSTLLSHESPALLDGKTYSSPHFQLHQLRYHRPARLASRPGLSRCLPYTSQICESHQRQKTDKRDAKRIANLFRFDNVKASFIPPADIRALCELSRYRLKLSYMRSAEKNRYQNSMTISRIRLFLKLLSGQNQVFPHGRRRYLHCPIALCPKNDFILPCAELFRNMIYTS